MFSHPESPSKIVNLELFYSYIRNMSLFIQEVSRLYTPLSLNTDKLKMAFRDEKDSFPGLSRNGTSVGLKAEQQYYCIDMQPKLTA